MHIAQGNIKKYIKIYHEILEYEYFGIVNTVKAI